MCQVRNAYVGVISGLDDSAVLSVNPISETIKSLGVIMCDICKQEKAAHDVFVEGPEKVAFLKRYCDKCVKMVSGSR
jgi:hypothetical protein